MDENRLLTYVWSCESMAAMDVRLRGQRLAGTVDGGRRIEVSGVREIPVPETPSLRAGLDSRRGGLQWEYSTE